MGAPAPTFIPEPFANQQVSTYINFPIPDAPPASPANAACWKLGFQAITMQPEVGGGLPPYGQDINGVLYTITTHTYALQAGQLYLWNGSFATTISGYEEGALLAMLDGTGLWMSIANANTTNPDNDSSNANWVPAFCYGIASLTGLTGGSSPVVVPPSESKRPVIELSGTLTANLTVELPAQVQIWLIVNNTTGSFTTTVKTPAGTGVTVPQGGAAQPTQVWCDGNNIYVTQSPLSTPISQAATALTLLERDNLGQGFLSRANLSSAYNENPAIGAVLVQSTALDGYTRWASLAYFLQQIFANAALTGAPTAPTQVVTDNSTKIATTAFVKALLGGQIFTFRTGTFNIVANVGGAVSFSSPFPTACLGAVASVPSGGFQPGCGSYSQFGFNLNGNACGTQLATYFAWGN